jgi:hypothetical protein
MFYRERFNTCVEKIRQTFGTSPLPEVTFATTCWERDWRQILLDPEYLRVRQIGNHGFPFAEKLLIINNVDDLSAVKRAAQKKIDEGIITRFVVADEIAEKMFSYFRLHRSHFQPSLESGVGADWLYYNALGPLAAVYSAKNPYLLYTTGDVWLEEPVSWIAKALLKMEKKEMYKVANLTWNKKYAEAKKEAYTREKNFYISRIGFSDQMFLVKKSDFCAPIYGEIREDTHHVPRGDVFEKRVLSYMKNHGWERMTYRHGFYTHA